MQEGYLDGTSGPLKREADTGLIRPLVLEQIRTGETSSALVFYIFFYFPAFALGLSTHWCLFIKTYEIIYLKSIVLVCSLAVSFTHRRITSEEELQLKTMPLSD